VKLNLKQVEAFVWVTDLGSFRKAATRLNTTQPNISGRVASLETVLGGRLMERDAGSVRLTSQGQRLLPYFRKVLSSTDELIEAAGRNDLVDGVLKLGVTEMVVNTWLREFLRRLKEHYPQVTVELTVDASVNIEKELIERSIDLALQNEPFMHRTSGNVDLGTYPIIWVAAPELGLHRAKKITLEQIGAHPILTHSRNTRLYEDINYHFMQHSPDIRIVSSNNLAACLQMAADAMGVASVPETMVDNELRTGELVKVNYHWVPESLHFMARYEAERCSQMIVKAAEVAGEVSRESQ